MRYLFILLLCSFSTKTLFAQKYLQIEKRNSTKVKRFMEGDVIMYKLKGNEENWKTEEIQRIIVENSILIMPNGMIKMEDISKLRFERYWTKAVEKSLYTFGFSWAFWNVIGTIFKEDKLERSDAVIVGTSLASGFLIRKIFKYHVIHMGKKRRLRCLDLNFSAVKS